MKLFPKKYYSIQLLNESSIAISELKNHTLLDEQFVVDWNSQAFIGKINNTEFEIKLSKKLYGTFCILKGKLDNKNGILEIGISKMIKILFYIIVVFIGTGLIAAIIQNKLEVLLLLLMTLIVFRFIFIELGFRITSKSLLKKLTEIIGITKIKNEVQHDI
ncbi:hypothetical protein D1815_02200 [Aquimarina sp. AD1]|uniref:hypothetical protein n=1 Tax=Aquimarina sp. (strain AD1) TaxID=1714848 RepID=UPI000E5428AB|nr:hypothetical protein [Aquimarina sp. AD1]AXT54618.1 hypothetical protein D1815_02200 [Aquimarina sp. AD1]RKN14734.1 hypothetical protein D7035_16695 [Aquimarina sp. AD1]